MRFWALIVPIMFVMGSVAKGTDVKKISGKCGDHWFKVRFSADVESKKSSINFSGDSGADKTLTGTLVRQPEDHSFRINFNEPEKGYLEIDGSDHYHNIFWGVLSSTGLKRDERSLGLCSIYWEN